MKIPKECAVGYYDFNSTNCGWFVPNSVRLDDIRPTWNILGGGRTEDQMFDNVDDAYKQAIVYTRQHIASAERHLAKLKKVSSL